MLNGYDFFSIKTKKEIYFDVHGKHNSCLNHGNSSLAVCRVQGYTEV